MGNKEPDRSANFAGSAFEQYGRELRRYLLRRLRNAQDARDLAQEVYLRLLRVDDPNRIAQPLAYVYRAASNVLAEFHMRQKQERVKFDSETAVRTAEHPPQLTPDELADRLSTERELQRVLTKLPAPYRTILLLRAGDGLSYAQIATQLGLSVHTVEKYFFRAVALVRAAEWD